MSLSALEKIKAIEQKAKEEISKLRAEAVSELARQLAEAKARVRELEAQYEAVTGKNVRGEAVESAAPSRRRMSQEEKAALLAQIREILKSNRTGTKMGDLLSQTGAPVSAVRNALAQIKELKTTGTKASTLYFLR